MNQYEKYKNSGIDWIGEIPSHWEIKRIKNLIRKKITDGPHETPEFVKEGIPFLSVDGIQDGELVFDGCRYITKDEHERFQKKTIVEKGDILMGKAASIGKIARVKTDLNFGVWSPLAIIKPNELIENVFFEYYLKSPLTQYQIEILCTSNTQKNISMDDIPKIKVITPPIHEQKLISLYLDKKTKKIDDLIKKKEKLIGLLKEERTAIINQLVTKGLNKKAKLKPSGVEWLRDIPEHWEVKKLKYIVGKVGSGVTPKGGAEIYLNEGIPLIRSQNVYFEGLRMDDVAYISEDIDVSMSGSRVFEGDVLLNITGASIGRCYFVPKGFGRGNVNQHVCIIRPSEKILTEYLYYLLSSGIGQEQIDKLQTGANREGLNFEQLKSFIFPIPTTNEQASILSELKTLTESNHKAISILQKEINLIKEYRTALINEVITGKVQVC